MLRGYERYRWLDKGAVFGAVTYKFPIQPGWDGILFYERGRVFEDLDALTFDDWRDSFGGGFRTWAAASTFFDLIIARSDEMTRIVFSFNTGL